MILRQFLHSDPVGASYFLACAGHATAAVVDPAGDIGAYTAVAEATATRIRYVIDTHLHADHVSAARALAAATGADYVLFAGAKVAFPFRAARDGDVLDLGNVAVKVLHTPGHTPGSICLYAEEQGLLFSGDTLFDQGMGRTDLPGGDETLLYQSLKRLANLPPDTRVFPGHGEATTIGDQAWLLRLGWEADEG